MEDLVASTLSSTLKIPHAVARFLVSRGIKTVSDAYHMLCSNESDVHDPFLMMGMDKAVEWILAVRERGERVFIFGDYDLDGMTSVTLLIRALPRTWKLRMPRNSAWRSWSWTIISRRAMGSR